MDSRPAMPVNYRSRARLTDVTHAGGFGVEIELPDGSLNWLFFSRMLAEDAVVKISDALPAAAEEDDEISVSKVRKPVIENSNLFGVWVAVVSAEENTFINGPCEGELRIGIFLKVIDRVDVTLRVALPIDEAIKMVADLKRELARPTRYTRQS